MKRVAVLFLAIAALTGSTATRAADKALLIELPNQVFPSGVSSDFTVVGGLGEGGGFHWMPTSGVVFIGGHQALSTSRDGNTIVGEALDAGGATGRHLAARHGVAAPGVDRPQSPAVRRRPQHRDPDERRRQGRGGPGVGRLRHRPRVPLGRVDRDGEPGQHRCRQVQPGGRGFGRREGRGGIPGARRPASGRALDGWADSRRSSRARSASWARRSTRIATGRSWSARCVAPATLWIKADGCGPRRTASSACPSRG